MLLDFSVIVKFLLKSAHIGMNAYNVLVIKYNGTRLIGRYRRRWGHNIEVGFCARKCVDVDCIHMQQVRDQLHTLVRAVTSLWTYKQST